MSEDDAMDVAIMMLDQAYQSADQKDREETFGPAIDVLMKIRESLKE